jgi:hypothetical protein
VAAPFEASSPVVPAETSAPPVAAEPAAVVEAAAPAPVISVAEIAPAAARAEPLVAPAAAVNVEQALQESGLVMIQTDPNKVSSVAPVVEHQFVPPRPRPRRPPPPDTGPLQIVETRKDA